VHQGHAQGSKLDIRTDGFDFKSNMEDSLTKGGVDWLKGVYF
jgi:hypothetical protein